MLLFHLNNVKWKRTWMVLCKGVCKWNQPALTSFGLEVTVRCSWLINRSKDHQSFQHCVWLPKHSQSNRRPTTIFCHVRTADLQQWRETGGEREWWMHTIDNSLAPLVYSQNQYIKCPHFRWLDTISPNGLHLGCWCQVRVPAEWPSRVGKNQNEESMKKVSTCVPEVGLTFWHRVCRDIGGHKTFFSRKWAQMISCSVPQLAQAAASFSQGILRVFVDAIPSVGIKTSWVAIAFTFADVLPSALF